MQGYLVTVTFCHKFGATLPERKSGNPGPPAPLNHRAVTGGGMSEDLITHISAMGNFEELEPQDRLFLELNPDEQTQYDRMRFMLYDVQYFGEKYGLGSSSDETVKEENADQNIVTPAYVFRNEGPSWTIIYEGITFRGLKGKGLEIIHYLVRHKGKDFRTSDLSKEFDKTTVAEEKKFATDESSSEDGRRFDEMKSQDVDDIIDDKTKTEVQDYRNRLFQELREAQDNNNIPRIEEIEQEIESLDEYLIASLKRSGKSQQFINETMRVKNRICKRIERALQHLEKRPNKNTYLHFKRALSPINSFFQSYRPDRHIDWLTE